MKRLAIVLCLAGGVLLVPAAAAADQYGFVGSHPIGPSADGGYCYIEAPHVHVYAPSKKVRVLYREHEDHYHFVGDPIAFGFDGPKFAFHGHHPVTVTVEVDGVASGGEYCYLDGPHFHYYEPVDVSGFAVKGGIHWYVGALPEEFERDRRKYEGINRLHARIEYERPVVVIGPPEGYVQPVIHVHGAEPVVYGEVGAGVGFQVGAGIEVDVHVPAPSVEVEVGLPFLVVEGHRHRGHADKKHKHKSRKLPKYGKHGKRGRRR